MRRSVTHRAVTLLGPPIMVLAHFGCGGAAETASPALVDPPVRTAAGDATIRSLLLDLADANLCDRLDQAFIALPDIDALPGAAGGASPAAGRLWVRSCRAERRQGQLALFLSGPGWTWAEQSSAGPLGSSFTVRGHLRFDTEVALAGEVDISYDESRRIVSVWLTPRTPAATRVTPTAAVPVEPDGGWSSFIGALGGLFGDSVEERAAPMVEEHGSAQMSERLSRGFTFTMDLCSGQADSIVGPLANGEAPNRPYAPDGRPWLANQRVRLRAGGLDAFGPFESAERPIRVDAEVEQGGDVSLHAYCQQDAARVIEAYLEGRSPSSPVEARRRQRVRRGSPSFVEIDASECPIVWVATPIGEEPDPLVYRYRVREVGSESRPAVRCGAPSVGPGPWQSGR